MLGILARLVGGALDPLIDQVSTASARLLRKLALFLVAAVCLIVVLGALTVAFDLWVASRFGAIAGALAVAGLYLVVAVAAVVLALRGERPRTKAATGARQGEKPAQPSPNAQIDALTAPLMAALAKLGLRREQLAVLAGSSLAKQLGPLPLVGLAIVAGFLVGRMWKSWRALLSIDALAGLLTSAAAIFGAASPTDAAEDEDAG